jgi:2-polyprenyl-6-methoxyphenol hydroxylase-like FAD-dependent oxidoreductase
VYDAIIVGAGVAGSATALLTQRASDRVLLLDNGKAAAHSAEIVWHAAVAKLDRWGLLEEFQALGAPAIMRARVNMWGTELTGSPAPIGKTKMFYVPLRSSLDKMLQEEAAKVGVEIRRGFEVTEIVKSGNRVTGIRGRNADGTAIEEMSKVVIGADGRDSVVAAAVKAAFTDEREPACACFYGLWSGLNLSEGDFTIREGAAYELVPAEKGLTRVGVYWSESAYPGSKSDPEATYHSILKADARVAGVLAGGKLEGKVAGVAEPKAFMRQAQGPGWALVGDASYYENPITAQGIINAFRDAELLAVALDEAFSGRRPLHAALGDYEVSRTELAGPMYEATDRRSRLKTPSPEVMQMIAALPGHQEDIDQCFGVDAGSVNINDFLDPDNLQRIIKGGQVVA